MGFPLLSTTVVLTASTLLVTYYIYSTVVSYLRLRHIPGPKFTAISRLPLIISHGNGHMSTDFGQWTEQYGPLVRIAPNQLITSDPDIWRRMNAVRSDYRRSDWYNAMRMKPGSDNVLSYHSVERHDELRRKMAAGYSGKENPRLEESIDNRILDFVSLIERKYLSDRSVHRPMDLGRKAQFFTLDVISDLAFNAPFGDLRDDEDKHNYVRDIEANVPIMITMAVLPEVHAFLEKSMIMNLLAPSAKDRTGLGSIIGVAQKAVAKRYDTEGKLKDQEDMLGSFLRHGLTREEAESEATLQVVAGSDTTAGAIRATFLHIITNPLVYAKLNTEIGAAEKSGLIPAVPGVIPDAVARELPYLQACIKEGLRAFPPVVGLQSKIVPKGGDTVNGYFIPEGTRIGYSAIGIHHSRTLFGDDARLFRPERWLLASQGGDCPSVEKQQAMIRNNELIFSYGRYQCLGKDVAAVELNKIFVELLRRFDFTVADPLKPWNSWCAGIFLQSEFWVRVTRKEE